MSTGPSSNWQKLQEQLMKSSKHKIRTDDHIRKRRRTESELRSARSVSPAASTVSHVSENITTKSGSSSTKSVPGRESIASLQNMVLGHEELNEKHKLPGKYLSLDCEMVGVGIDGAESSLARVSLVNFYGAVIMDEFVKQRERVVDYRTQYSGIRETDMIHAKPFLEVQKQVADLLKDRILVGHAVHNDLKALLLSHPYPLTRDTQVLAFKSKITKTKRVALRNIVKQEIGLTIQQGEHSSVTDARATMAVYRLHKKEWDKILAHLPPSLAPGTSDKKRKHSEIEKADDAEPKTDGPKRKGKHSKSVDRGGQGRKGVSSGLSTIVRRTGKQSDQQKQQWWKQLPAASGAKGSLKL